jgi:hypothetical protein
MQQVFVTYLMGLASAAVDKDVELAIGAQAISQGTRIDVPKVVVQGVGMGSGQGS